MAVFRFLLPFFLVMFGTSEGCSPPIGWETKPLEVRAREPRLVVYGTVLTDETVGDSHQDGSYVLKPKCWLRHDMPGLEQGFANITVVERYVDCVKVTLHKGKEYIIFLSYDNDMFVIADVNVQSGTVEEPTDEDFQTVYRGIDTGVEGVPDGKCLEGVDIPCFVGEIDESECSKGVTVEAAMVSILMALMFSFIV